MTDQPEPEDRPIMHFDEVTYPLVFMENGEWWIQHTARDFEGPYSNVFEANAHIKKNEGENLD